MKARGFLTLLAAVLTTACGLGALQGGTIGGGGTINTAPTYTFGIVACAVDVGQADHCPSPIVGATVYVDHSDGYVQGTTNGDGFVLMYAQIPFSDIKIKADGFYDFGIGIQPPQIDHKNLTFSLRPKIPPMPAPPTRDEILNLRLTFQGLMVNCDGYGNLPWFEAALPWLPADCRQEAYKAKLASAAWAGGDTHVLINLPSGPPLYDEPGQPYAADRFPALDWTEGGTHIDHRLPDLIAEAARAGFNRQLLFLGGDDGERGYPIALAQLDLVHDALVSSAYGDLRPYIVVIPGWDGVFYGYTPEHVAAWGAKCRQLFVYCGLEHQPGRIPVGEGDGDYRPGGRMTTFDLILAEFNGPNDSAWRAHLNGRDAQGHPDYNGNQIWQIGIRMLGSSVYIHPADQPSDADAYSGPSILQTGSPRGPYRHCAFEWVGEYNFVRGWETPAQIQSERDYFKSMGYTCGG